MEGVGRKGWFERVGLQGGIESRRNRMLSVCSVEMYSKRAYTVFSFKDSGRELVAAAARAER